VSGVFGRRFRTVRIFIVPTLLVRGNMVDRVPKEPVCMVATGPVCRLQGWAASGYDVEY